MIYLTIREFGSLRGVSVGSLRYYEKLGLLKPAKVDPETGYRYYLPEQIETLDAIQMCVALDIPLKELAAYFDEEGRLDLKGILMRGRKVMKEKLEQMKMTLQITEYGLDMLRRNESYCSMKDVYQRRIEERWYFVFPASRDKKKLQDEQKALLRHFRRLQKEEMAPLFPACILIRPGEKKEQVSYLIRVLRPGSGDQGFLHIPEGNFRCLQMDMADHPDPAAVRDLIHRKFPDCAGRSVIITNMMTEKLHYRSQLSEIQIPED